MKYKCLSKFVDLEDDHRYYTGDQYPHDGRRVSKARINELTTDQNLLGYPVIEEVPEDGEIPFAEPEAE